MGVYIPGTKMPVKCALCDAAFPDGVGWSCPLTKGRPIIDNQKGRRRGCPLVPVPAHGDLIDRAELWVEINKICDRRDAGIITDLACLQQILSAVRHAPTIITAEPAEEGET